MAGETFQRQCEWCGKDFEASHQWARFHSGVCRQAYWRWRHRLQLEVARARDTLREVHRFTDHEATADEAWAELQQLREWLDWLMETDAVGTRKMRM